MVRALEAFGKYLLLEKIAAGGMAEVFLAKSVGAGGIVKFLAMKRILPQFSENQEFIDMFKEEAKLVMNLNHGNIVSIFDFGIEKNQFYLIMEYVEGQNLRQTLNHLKRTNRALTIDQIVYIIKEVAAGLDHAHRCVDSATGKTLNITHRDISPQNIMLSFEGEVKVVDFGIAKTESQIEHTRAGTIKGKFGYMSPEQAEGLPVDSRTDIFSLGIVLWELLANERLFTAQSEQATLRKIKECQIPSIRKLNPSVHTELEKIVLKALERIKTSRYQSMEDFTKDLSKFLNTQYPEFSKQEFSKYMKAAYSDMYLENRKKLAEYAKSEFANDTQSLSEKTVITESKGNTQTESHAQTHTATEKHEIKEINEFEKPLFENEQNEPLNQTLLLDTRGSQKIDISKFAIEGKKPVTAPPIKQQNYSNRVPTHTGTYSGGSKKIQPQNNSSSGLFIQLLVVLIFVGGGYWFWSNQNQAKIARPIAGSISNPKSDSQPMHSATSNEDVALSINSSPAEAKIYIDDIYIGDTPLRSHIALNKTFRVRIIKPGYIPYELPAEKANPEGYYKVVSLLPEAASGWIKVEVVTPEPQSYLVINGRKLNQSINDEIKVPAGSIMTVKVINPISKMEGSDSVIVGAGEHKKVRIIINRAAQVQQ